MPRQTCQNVSRTECENVPHEECEDVPSEQCGKVHRQVPRNVTGEKCEYRDKEVCVPVPRVNCTDPELPRQVCEQIPKEICVDVERQECTEVPRQECTDAPTVQCAVVPEEITRTVIEKQCTVRISMFGPLFTFIFCSELYQGGLRHRAEARVLRCGGIQAGMQGCEEEVHHLHQEKDLPHNLREVLQGLWSLVFYQL